MNERGFFTIIGLCLLIIVAISIKGVNEFEANYSKGITNFQIEHKLQTLAESFLAAEIENIMANENYSTSKTFGDYDGLKNCAVQIHAQNMNMKNFIRVYNSSSNYTDTDAGENPINVTAVISVASCDSPFIVGKIYRRALAYIDKTETIHFMNSL